MIVGLTGGICMGKSAVAKTFIKHGIPEIDADLVAREVVVPGSKGLFEIQKYFGDSYLNEDGTLNRSKLSNLVFNDSSSMKILNNIMSPLIQDEVNKKINDLANHSIILYNAALIVEMGNVKKYRPLIVVSCPTDVQLTRLMSRNSLTRDEAMSRINAQVSDEHRRSFADFIIDSSAPLESSILQTEEIIKHLREINAGHR